jgi:hypothetical protein
MEKEGGYFRKFNKPDKSHPLSVGKRLPGDDIEPGDETEGEAGASSGGPMQNLSDQRPHFGMDVPIVKKDEDERGAPPEESNDAHIEAQRELRKDMTVEIAHLLAQLKEENKGIQFSSDDSYVSGALFSIHNNGMSAMVTLADKGMILEIPGQPHKRYFYTPKDRAEVTAKIERFCR